MCGLVDQLDDVLGEAFIARHVGTMNCDRRQSGQRPAVTGCSSLVARTGPQRSRRGRGAGERCSSASLPVSTDPTVPSPVFTTSKLVSEWTRRPAS
jgi:hypothetical protein